MKRLFFAGLVFFPFSLSFAQQNGGSRYLFDRSADITQSRLVVPARPVHLQHPGSSYHLFERRQPENLPQITRPYTSVPTKMHLPSLDRDAYATDGLGGSLSRSLRMSWKPWSDVSWKLHSGLIAMRRHDPNFRSFGSSTNGFRGRYDYIRRYDLDYLARIEDVFANDLSPAEKYDLMIGDLSAPLTQRMWAVAWDHWNDRNLREWMGVCEGTAVASIEWPEPRKNVVVYSPWGHKIIFRPEDIKALAALVASEPAMQMPLTGERCTQHWVDQNTPRSELPLECRDINPGLWHFELLSRMTLGKKVFLVDRSFEAAVWNSVLYKYEYSYFHPSTNERGTLGESLLALNRAVRIPRPANRSGQAAYLVGVNMTLHYVDTSAGSHRNNLIVHDLVYDLELDESKNIVGGEWFSEYHPDFIWDKPTSESLFTRFEPQRGDYWTGDTLPDYWKELAQKSAQEGRPLKRIVDELVQRSL